MNRIEKITKKIKEIFYPSKTNSPNVNRQKIRSLHNMSFNFEKLLKRIDINTIEEFKAKGEIKMFVELIKVGVDADHMMLFKLYGAVHEQLVREIPPKEKLKLLHDANEALSAVGLPRRFKLKS